MVSKFRFPNKLVAMVLFILMVFTSGVYAAGEWPVYRNGNDNTGNASMAGQIASTPRTAWSSYIGGDFTSALSDYDVNNDGYKDLIFSEAGSVVALDRNFSQIWKSAVLPAANVFGVYDLDGNGTKEIIATTTTNKIVVLSASNGSKLWELQCKNAPSYYNFKVEDLDEDGKQEIVFYIYSEPYIYCYTFKNGAANGTSLWTVTDPRSENDGNISAYSPEMAVGDVDNDGIKEVAVVRYEGMDFYDGRTGLLDVPSSMVNIASAASGASVDADSEYPGGGYPKSRLIDGNVGSYWINNRTVPGWVTVTFSSSKYVKYVNLFGTGCSQAFNVQTWDGSQWVTQSSVSSNYRNQVLVTFTNKVYTGKIRINITQSSGYDGLGQGNHCQMSEVQAYEELPSIGWASSINGATITADSEYPGGGYPKTNINDGNTGTYWINSRTVPGWIQADFVASQNIRYVKLSGVGTATAFNVQTWNGSSWVTQKSVTANSAFSRLIKFSSAVSTSKIRVTITSSTANDGLGLGYQCQFSELEAYETYPGSTNLSAGSSMTVDSEYPGGGYPKANLNDGNSATYWINSRAVPGWAYADLLDSKDIQYIYLNGMQCSQAFEIQTWNGTQWATQKSVSGNYAANPMVKLDSPVSTSRVKVNITQSSANDGQGYMCQMSELQVSEGPKDFTTSQRTVEWLTGGGEDHGQGRNYGFFKLMDIDNDGCKEGIIVADGVSKHIGVVDNSQHGTQLLWDRYIEYDSLVTKIVRVVPDPVQDIDGDGKVEIVYGVYDTTIPGWTLYIVDAYTNTNKQTISGLYLWGMEDVNNDGKKELLVSEESAAAPAAASTIRVYGHSSGTYQSIWSKASSAFLTESGTANGNEIGDNCYGARQRPLLIDTDSNNVKEFLINDAGVYKAIDCTNGTTKWSSSAGVPKKVVSLFNNGDYQVITVNQDGEMKLINEAGSTLSTRNAGAGTNKVAVTQDIDGDGSMEMVISDSVKTRVYRLGSSGATKLWEDAGKGITSYSSANSAAVIDNMDGDAAKEIIVRDVNAQDQPIIKVLSATGSTEWSYAFSGYGSNTIYQWLTADFNGDGTKDIYVAILENGIDTGRSRIINGATRTLLWSSPDTYTITPPAPYASFQRSVAPYPGYASARDVDGDGKDELIFISLNVYFRFDWNSSTSTMDETHFYTGNTDVFYHTPVLTSVDDNGTIENVLMAGFDRFTVYDGAMAQLLGSLAADKYEIMRRMQGIGDVDNAADNKKEIAVQYTMGSLAGYLYCYDASNLNTVKWSVNLAASFGDGVMANDIQTCDIDNDGRKEFIFTTNTGYLIAVNGEQNPSSRILWSVNVGVTLGSPILTDTDGDSYSEVLVFAGDGKVYTFDSP